MKGVDSALPFTKPSILGDPLHRCRDTPFIEKAQQRWAMNEESEALITQELPITG